ncbi:MAG: PspC domain-containing protein [Anaerolineales bacterium]
MAQEIKRLYRSRTNRMLGGVAGGLAEYLDADPTIIRLIFAFSFLLGGTGILIYLVVWLVISEAPAASLSSARKTSSRGKSS